MLLEVGCACLLHWPGINATPNSRILSGMLCPPRFFLFVALSAMMIMVLWATAPLLNINRACTCFCLCRRSLPTNTLWGLRV